MKKLVIIFLFFTITSLSQTGKIFGEFNYNTFSHSILKEFQKEFTANLPQVPFVTGDDFPANYGFTAGYELVEDNVAIFVSYNFTGGKISYSDFSGSIKLEMPLNTISIGSIYFVNLDSNQFRLGLKGFTSFTNLKVRSEAKISNNSNLEELEFNSTDFGIGVQLNYEYPISFFILKVNAGFDFVFGGKLLFKDNKENFLIDNSGDQVKTEWTGFRTGIGIAIPIK